MGVAREWPGVTGSRATRTKLGGEVAKVTFEPVTATGVYSNRVIHGTSRSGRATNSNLNGQALKFQDANDVVAV